MWKKRSRIIFFTSTMIAAVILFQMAMYCLQLFLHWDVKYNVFQLCHSFIKRLGFTALEYVLDIFVVYTVVLCLWQLLKQIYLTHKIRRRFEMLRDENATNIMLETFQVVEHTITVISHVSPIAVTIGFFQPKIILSTGLIDLLKKNELEAVIYHELSHKQHLDPLKIFVLSIISSTIWYIPILKWLCQKYKILKELLADSASIQIQGSASALGSALLKLLKAGIPTQMDYSYVSFADTSINYRIKQLVNPMQEFPLQLPPKQTMISSVVFFVLCCMFVYVLCQKVTQLHYPL